MHNKAKSVHHLKVAVFHNFNSKEQNGAQSSNNENKNMASKGSKCICVGGYCNKR